jgi:hypothetical protein
MFLSIFVIIYLVEHINHFNAIIFSPTPTALVQNKGLKNIKNPKKVKK